jgi:diadenosine tetraphosphatase ApaH/serine/threonine PP2A family protein phosphatase
MNEIDIVRDISRGFEQAHVLYDAKYVARWTRELKLVNLLKECLK